MPDTYDYREGKWRALFGAVGPFGPIESRRFGFVHALSPAEVVDRVASVSFIAVLPPAEREAVAAEVRALLAGHADTRGRATLEMPYLTDVFVAAAT